MPCNTFQEKQIICLLCHLKGTWNDRNVKSSVLYLRNGVLLTLDKFCIRILFVVNKTFPLIYLPAFFEMYLSVENWGSKFLGIPFEGWRVYQLKLCVNKKYAEDKYASNVNNLNNLSDVHNSSSFKYRTETSYILQAKILITPSTILPKVFSCLILY